MEKIAPELEARLAGSKGSEMLEIVLELRAQEAQAPDTAKVTKIQRIAQLHEDFCCAASPVEETIRQSGGEVTAVAWLNQTVHARVPARAVEVLAELDRVEFLDLPRELTAD